MLKKQVLDWEGKLALKRHKDECGFCFSLSLWRTRPPTALSCPAPEADWVGSLSLALFAKKDTNGKSEAGQRGFSLSVLPPLGGPQIPPTPVSYMRYAFIPLPAGGASEWILRDAGSWALPTEQHSLSQPGVLAPPPGVGIGLPHLARFLP